MNSSSHNYVVTFNEEARLLYAAARKAVDIQVIVLESSIERRIRCATAGLAQWYDNSVRESVISSHLIDCDTFTNLVLDKVTTLKH